MKGFYVGLVILVWFSSSGNCDDSSHLESSLDGPIGHKRGLLKDVSGVLDYVPGLKGIKSDLWGVISSFDICELRCTGKLCSCCQKRNLMFIHLSVCMNFYLKPSEKQVEVSMSTGNMKLFSFHVLLHKTEKICKSMGKRLAETEFCIYTTIKDYGADGFSTCATADLTIKGIKTIELNFDCFSFSGDILFNGRTTVDGKTLAFLRVLNPIKFVELIKRILFN